MTKIQIREKHLSGTIAASEAQRCSREGIEISDACAVSIAAWWQGSGRLGSALAAFASGAEVDMGLLQKDLSETISEYYNGVSSMDRLSLNMLGTYLVAKRKELEAKNSGDPEKTAQEGRCPECGKEYERHAVSGEMTCFLHGNPVGSVMEKLMWEKRDRNIWNV